MLLDLRRRQTIQGLRLDRLRTTLLGLLRLPVAIGLVRHHAERGQTTIGQRLAAHLSRLLAAQQQADRTGRQRAATGAREQTAQASAREQTA